MTTKKNGAEEIVHTSTNGINIVGGLMQHFDKLSIKLNIIMVFETAKTCITCFTWSSFDWITEGII